MNNSRGSIWRKCDFHVHSPFSALENKFGSEFDTYVKTLFTKAIEKRIEVIGITDYFTIDGYKKVKTEYLANEEKLKQLFTAEEILKIKNILVLPNIEFRLNKIVQIIKINGSERRTENGRINFHVIFSNEVPIKTIEESFLHDIKFVYEAEPNESDKLKSLKLDNLLKLGEKLKNEQPDILGTHAQIGMTHAVVDDVQIVEILTKNNDFKDKYFIAVPSDEDLSEIQWKSQDGLTRKILISRCHALFSSNSKTIEFGLGEKAEYPEDFIKEFKSLKPCIWGSDAHSYDKLFEPDKERYCWIKADPTFEGMRQILFEPKDRVFIGKYPALYDRIKSSRNNYIDSISINSIAAYDKRKGVWFDDFRINLGFELIAIIGNKGKGKSALADILGLLGNAHVEQKDFSFLNRDKFCQRGYAENFTGVLTWFDKTQSPKQLNENIDYTNIERVKYIPQSYLEKLCNNEDGAFKEEINKVVFLRLDDSDKLGMKSFDELESFQTQLINQKIEELKIKLNDTNKSIDIFELKSSDDYKSSIKNKLLAKKSELENHEIEKSKIVVAINPETDSSASKEQREKAEKLSELNRNLEKVETSIESEEKKLSDFKIKLSELEIMLNEIISTSEKFEAWRNGKAEHYQKYDLDIKEIISLTYNTQKLEEIIAAEKVKIGSLNIQLSKDSVKKDNVELSLYVKKDSLYQQREVISKDLEKPFKDWQEYQQKLKDWYVKKKIITGDSSTDNSLLFYQAELNYLEQNLQNDLTGIKEKRNSIVLSIYSQKQEVQNIYNKIKEAISTILQNFSKEQNISIETSFKIDKSFFAQFFDYVNRYGTYYQNGDDALKKITEKYNFDDPADITGFIDELSSSDIRFKEGRKQDFYNFICSLKYLNPEYDLRLNGKSLGQLSPGEKGGLLLVFYLVLDKDNKPLIIDQPEDNLDNQSVAEILVPYIKNAKKMRQIIMVTHNPNLAIVADAEQIIYMDIDKENDYKVSCNSGGIENITINNRIVDILEGKMKAFDNRRVKYMK